MHRLHMRHGTCMTVHISVYYGFTSTCTQVLLRIITVEKTPGSWLGNDPGAGEGRRSPRTALRGRERYVQATAARTYTVVPGMW